MKPPKLIFFCLVASAASIWNIEVLSPLFRGSCNSQILLRSLPVMVLNHTAACEYCQGFGKSCLKSLCVRTTALELEFLPKPIVCPKLVQDLVNCFREDVWKRRRPCSSVAWCMCGFAREHILQHSMTYVLKCRRTLLAHTHHPTSNPPKTSARAWLLTGVDAINMDKPIQWIHKPDLLKICQSETNMIVQAFIE